MTNGTNSTGGEGSWRFSRRRLLQLGALGVAGTAGASSNAAAAMRTLAFEGMGSYASYSVAVSGSLAGNGGLSGEDKLAGSRASGAVKGGADHYRFTGEITELTIDGSVDVTIDGEHVPSEELFPNTLDIDGTGSYASYTIAASGGLVGDGLSGEDKIDVEQGRARGAVGGGTDSYRFASTLTALDVGSERRCVTTVRRSTRMHPSRTRLSSTERARTRLIRFRLPGRSRPMTASPAKT